MKNLSIEQRRTIADFVSNVGVVWVGGGIISPTLAGQSLSQALTPAIWSFLLAMLSLGFGVWIGKK